MKEPERNLLTQALAALCEAHRLEEKWLLAPDWWIGHQWIDAVARSGRSVLNLRVKSLGAIALELAAPELTRRGARRLSGVASELVVGALFAGLAEKKGGYLSPLAGSPGLVEALHRAVSDLRLAGLDSRAVASRRFEVEEKGREIRTLLGLYEEALKRENAVDSADLLRIAAARLRSDPSALPDRALVLIASDTLERLRGLALDLWKALPPDRTRVLAVDAPATPVEGDPSDARLLRWISRPAETPMPSGDGTAAVSAARGEVGEVKAVLRRCVAEAIPFDDVEILHTDTAVYVPLIHELGAGLGAAPPPGAGFTFAEGIPVRYARPARALTGWIAWIRGGFPGAVLSRMTREGLLDPGPAGSTGDAIDRLAFGVDRESPARAVLAAASSFLKTRARCADRFDRYSLERLVNELDEITGGPGGDLGWISDPFGELLDLIDQAHVLSEGPRPGAIHVASLWRGGHSGRGHTFIIGLDDTRFPGRGLQDPLLLDAERRAISPELPTSGGRLAQKTADLALLMARLRGRVFLSFSARSLDDDRRLFPSSAISAAFRILSGFREIDSETLLAKLPAPESFAPRSADQAVDSAEWWLAQTCGDWAIADPEKLLADHFPNLKHGQAAAEARASDRFTEYDGHVPEAGRACDPFGTNAPPVSASRLERLGKCPLDYFFSEVLEIAPPEEPADDPAVWLDPAGRGKLLHALFRAFMERLQEKGERPDFGRHEALLAALLRDCVAAERAENPPLSDTALDREAALLGRIARIFLREEARVANDGIPAFFEASIGLPPEGNGSAIDSLEPVEIALPGGRTIRARGRIDRIDRVADGRSPRFALWDYKTGNAYGYNRANPHREGRIVQNTLYAEMAKLRLKAIDPAAEVASSGYFFPGIKEYGKRIAWPAAELTQGPQVIAWLCELLASGCFPETNDPADLRYSDYAEIRGDGAAATAESARKLSNPENRMLEPFMRLRDCRPEEGEGDG